MYTPTLVVSSRPSATRILESLSANLAAVDTRLRAASEPATQMAMVANEVSAFVSNAEPAESAA